MAASEIIRLRSANCEGVEGRPGVVAAREAGNAQVVHGHENEVDAHEGEPEVDITQLLVHHPPKQLRKPVVHPGKHPEERRRAHHQVKVGNDEVRVVQLNIERRVAQHNAREAARDEE